MAWTKEGKQNLNVKLLLQLSMDQVFSNSFMLFRNARADTFIVVNYGSGKSYDDIAIFIENIAVYVLYRTFKRHLVI